jgi:hypothetical protein
MIDATGPGSFAKGDQSTFARQVVRSTWTGTDYNEFARVFAVHLATEICDLSLLVSTSSMSDRR